MRLMTIALALVGNAITATIQQGSSDMSPEDQQSLLEALRNAATEWVQGEDQSTEVPTSTDPATGIESATDPYSGDTVDIDPNRPGFVTFHAPIGETSPTPEPEPVPNRVPTSARATTGRAATASKRRGGRR